MLTYSDAHFSPEAMPSLVVLPRFPDAYTGTGQRSLLLIEAAMRLGPVHIVLLDGGGQVEALAARPGIASVSVLHSDRIAPAGMRRRLLGPLRLALPRTGYAVDPAFRAALVGKIRETGARYVIFRYARLFCAAGLDDGPELRVFVDVDDRDDQKYASRLARLFGPGFPDSGIGRWRLGELGRVLRGRLARAALVWFASEEDVWQSLRTRVGVLANVPHFAPDHAPAFDPDSRTVLFVGSHFHVPNRDGVRWFLGTCWPDVRATCPEARLRIVGSGRWPGFGEACGPLDGVTFVGRVEDLTREYAAARVCICPVREGGGSKIKVIEAAAFARPVVATSHALRGFGDLAGLAARADTATETVAALRRYFCDVEQARADGDALREAQKMQFSRNRAVERAAGDMSLALSPAIG